MRSIALQSAVGGMAASVAGMGLAAAGLLPPTAGALRTVLCVEDNPANLMLVTMIIPPLAIAIGWGVFVFWKV